MKTLLGTEIPEWARGIVYLCGFKDLKLTVFHEIFFEYPGAAFMAYAEIPNPASQMATGKTPEEFKGALQVLHNNMKDTKWLLSLSEQL